MKPLFSTPRLPRELKQPVSVSLSSATDDILLTWVSVQRKNGAPRPSRSSVIREIVEVLQRAGWSPNEMVFKTSVFNDGVTRESLAEFDARSRKNRKPQKGTTPAAAPMTKHKTARR
jgi:hypothetical protein